MDHDTTGGNEMTIRTLVKCIECGRVFDLADEHDADEWYYGHDCEDES